MGGRGDADDFSVDGAGGASRAAFSDTSTSLANGRIATASTPTALTDTLVSVSIETLAVSTVIGALSTGVVARYRDTSNFLAAYLQTTSNIQSVVLNVVKRVAGTSTTILSQPISYGSLLTLRYKITLRVAADGLVGVSARVDGCWSFGAQSDIVGMGHGACDRRRACVGDGRHHRLNSSPSLSTRYFDIGSSRGPWFRTLVFYARQAAELRYDGAIRANSGGTAWALLDYEGGRLGGSSGRSEPWSARFLVKAARVALRDRP